jgi:ribosomal L7/L12-like protein
MMMSRLATSLRVAIAIVVVVVFTLLATSVGVLAATGAWWVLGLFWSAFTWWEIVAALRLRKLAGPVLVSAGSILGSIGQYRADSLVAFALIVASFFAAAREAHNSLPNELALALAAATFIVRCLVVGLSGRAMTERGIMGSGEFMRWEQIEGYEWVGAQANVLALRLKWPLGRSGSTPHWPIPLDRKEAVDRLLSQHVAVRPVGAVNAETETNGAPAGQYDQLLAAQWDAARSADGRVNRILLIKALREATNLGLKEAKDAVDEYHKRRFSQSPPPHGAQ